MKGAVQQCESTDDKKKKSTNTVTKEGCFLRGEGLNTGLERLKKQQGMEKRKGGRHEVG